VDRASYGCNLGIVGMPLARKGAQALFHGIWVYGGKL